MRPEQSPTAEDLLSDAKAVELTQNGDVTACESEDNTRLQDSDFWYVMRDLTRPNAKKPAWKMLEELGYRYYTPTVWKLVAEGGHKKRRRVPIMHDLVFVHEPRERIETVVEGTKTFQFRYVRGGVRLLMTVSDAEMTRFIGAVQASEAAGLTPSYLAPDEITPAMRGRRIRILSGPLEGYEGTLVTVRGSRTRRILVEIPDVLAAAIEVSPEFIELL